MGSDKSIQYAEKEWHRAKSKERLTLLTTLYAAVYNLMIHKPQSDVWMEMAGKDPSKSKNLKYYLSEIELATGIKVKKLEDLEELQKVIDRWIEKYHEHFPEQPEDEKSTPLTFMQIVMGVFSSMGMRIEYSMSISDFLDLKQQAEERSKSQKHG